MNMINKSRTALIMVYWLLNSLALASSINIIYSGSLDGELEPCGCTAEGDFGGLKRQATVIDGLLQQDPSLVLLSTGGALVADLATDQIKSKYILNGLELLNYDAVGVQWQDLNFGAGFLKQVDVPFVLSKQNSQFAVKRIIKRQNLSMVFYHWPEEQEHPIMHADELTASGFDRAEFENELRKSKQAGYVTIVSTPIRKKRLAEKLPLSYIDILIRPARSEQFSQPEKINGALVLEAGSRGMRFGQLKIKLDKNNSISGWQHEVIDVNNKVQDSARMAAWYKAYTAELEQDYKRRVEIRKSIAEGISPYAGAKNCQKCHDEEYSIWEKSEHAHAFASLEKVNKIYDSNCVACHTVGYEKPGGFFDAVITEYLKDVQCESCHGAAREHVDSKGKTLTSNNQWSRSDICQQCHTNKHSPVFDIDKYWPDVEH
ncbi:MAG: multiheme c-type cytochrome [Gammaproteobacteria bacterium]|nr:multiheme c-type cytochrome [Gammaproteobacteria bacterium]